jgi:C4-dicarboxylate transporter DctQ subunit
MNKAKFIEFLFKLVEIFCAGFLFLIALFTIAQVIMRYMFSYSFTWSEELSIALFAYIGFIGIGVAYSQNKHLYVDALIAILPQSIRKVIDSIALALTIIFLVVVIFQIVKIMNASSKVEITTPALQLPMVYIYLSIPVGCLLFLIQVVKRFWNLLRE